MEFLQKRQLGSVKCEVSGRLPSYEIYKSAHKLRKLSSRPDAVDLGRAERSHPVAVLPVCPRSRPRGSQLVVAEEEDL